MYPDQSDTPGGTTHGKVLWTQYQDGLKNIKNGDITFPSAGMDTELNVPASYATNNTDDTSTDPITTKDMQF